jgi:hypothetical protein
VLSPEGEDARRRRAERLAQELRRNLLRRKAQKRGRAAAGKEETQGRDDAPA